MKSCECLRLSILKFCLMLSRIKLESRKKKFVMLINTTCSLVISDGKKVLFSTFKYPLV